MSREIRTHLNGVLCALQVIEQDGHGVMPDDMRVYQAMHTSAIGLFSEVDLLLMYIQSMSG